MKIMLCTHPRDAKEAEKHTFPVCHMAYRIGPEMQLYRNGLGINVRGGFLLLSDAGFDRSLPYSGTLIREVAWECANRGFSGLICDFEGEPSPVLREFIYDAAETLKKYGMALYVPRAYAAAAPDARIFLSSAVLGGNCAERYTSDLQVFGPGRTALLIEPVAVDIPLPSEQEEKGRHLSPEELTALMRREGGIPYLSRELCASYFTYRDGEGKSHFMLFDDSRSILRKLQLAKDLGFEEALVLFPDARDILEELKEL